jgi:hypothetical protein
MPHHRQRIREGIAAALGSMPALAGRVYTMRVRRTQPEELPVVLVYALQEESARVAKSLDRRLSVAIEIRSAVAHDLDDRLDDLAIYVEAAVMADPKIGLLAIDTVLRSTAIGLDGEGESQHGVAVLNFEVNYRTDPANPAG